MGDSEIDLAAAANVDDLAKVYEFLILNGISVPVDLDMAMRDAHRRVHLRGLDPLRKAGR